MSTDTIFFSYSRVNSEFVLNLAKNLRTAGANIWLDQLDIKPGTRWDSSIEEALSSSNTLLIILSKSSVASHNVMDEVSFALEEGKLVVPILIEECDIPFRLRRLQYADFTRDLTKGIETLIRVLQLDPKVASKLKLDAKNLRLLADAKNQTAPQSTNSNKIVEKKKGSRRGLLIFLVLILALGSWGVYKFWSGNLPNINSNDLTHGLTEDGTSEDNPDNVDPTTLTPDNANAEALSEEINLTVSNWQNMSSSADLSSESISSVLPDKGIRGRYQIAKKELSKAVLESIVGEKAFLSGPHEEGINYNSANEFGHYNPEFLTKLTSILTTTFSNKTFVDNAQALYDSQLKQYLRTYYLAYDMGANKQELKDGYLYAISNNSSPSMFLQESFRDFAESLEGKGYDVYESFVCPGFWVRRSIDGTADEFYDLLILTINTFDADFLNE